MLIPNADRVSVHRLKIDENKQGSIVLPGQMVAGENLLAGKVIHPGETKFKVDQIVYFSEYSVSRILDVGKVATGKATMGEVYSEENIYIVAEDDIMAYEE